MENQTKRIQKLQEEYKRIQEELENLQQTVENLEKQKTEILKSTQEQKAKRQNYTIQYSDEDTPIVRRVREECARLSLYSARFAKVPANYYDLSLEERRKLLDAPTIHHLCKSMIMENTACRHNDLNPENSKYYCVIVQYTQKIDTMQMMKFIREYAEKKTGKKIGKKQFNFRCAKREVGEALTGYERNAVTPIGMKTNIPIILCESITKLQPNYFWLGGGEVDVKLELSTPEFLEIMKPIVADISVPRADDDVDDD